MLARHTGVAEHLELVLVLLLVHTGTKEVTSNTSSSAAMLLTCAMPSCGASMSWLSLLIPPLLIPDAVPLCLLDPVAGAPLLHITPFRLPPR